MLPISDFDLAHSYFGASLTRPLEVPPILASLQKWATSDAGRPFLTVIATDGTQTQLTYGELETRSCRFASWLQSKKGVAPGDSVAIAPTNDIESVVAVIGILRAGAAILFLNPADPPSRVAQKAEALHVELVLSVVGQGGVPGDCVIPSSEEIQSASTRLAPFDIDPLEPAFYFGTSGSTAISKLVAQSHYAAAVNAEAVRRVHQLQPRDRVLGCLPIHHVNGLHFTIVGTLVAGAHTILAAAFDPFAYPTLIERYKPRIASVVPSVLEVLLATRRSLDLPSEFSHFLTAAAPLPKRVATAVRDRMRARVIQGYGLTETINFATTVPLGLTDEIYRRHIFDAEIPSIGTPVYGNEVAVLGSDGSRLAPGEIGEICVRGHNVMIGYAGNDDASRAAFLGGWFHTQDRGYEVVDPESGLSFFTTTGRMKNVAKVGGEAVSLDEIDRVLRAHPQIRDAVCVARPDRFIGDKIVALVVPSGTDWVARVSETLAATFAPSARPRAILSVAAIPRTPTGKIARAELEQLLSEIESRNDN